MTDRARVLEALGSVHDPELDAPITSLRFVTACEVSAAGEVQVRLRLPTPQCAPNFAYLIAADAREAVRRLPGVRGVTVTLEDHYTASEINDAVAGGGGFTAAFPGETDNDALEDLRALFQRKALLARQARLCDALMREGLDETAVVALTVADLEPCQDTIRCLELRAALGLDASPGAPAFVLPGGEPVSARELPRWLRMARLVQTSLEVNGGMCRSLLQFRYALPDEEEMTL
jgi:metal-sulfur cluster biosynthetic enzyme